MKASTSYLIGAIVFLLTSGYLILSVEWVWHSVVTIVLTFIAGVAYTVAGIKETRKEHARPVAAAE